MRCGSARCRSSSEQMGCSRAKVRCRSASRLVVAGGGGAATVAPADATVEVDGSSSMREAAASEELPAGQGEARAAPARRRTRAGTYAHAESEGFNGAASMQCAGIHRCGSRWKESRQAPKGRQSQMGGAIRWWLWLSPAPAASTTAAPSCPSCASSCQGWAAAPSCCWAAS